MRNKFKKFLMIFLILPIVVHAENAAYVDVFKTDTTNKVEAQSSLGSTNFAYHPAVSSYYEFFDKDGNYNVLFEIKSDSKNLGWAKFDSDLNLISEITIPRYLDLFGNAIYDDNYLYVAYGANDYDTFLQSSSNFATSVTMEIVKYNMTGNVVKTLEVKGLDTSYYYNKQNTSKTFIAYGTRFPFNAGNCDLAVSKNGVLRVHYARQMYNGHQSSFSIYVDINNFTQLNKSSDMTINHQYHFLNNSAMISHSLDQRVIATSDGMFLSVDKSDGTPERGFVFQKSYLYNNVYNLSTMTTFHFRESTDETGNTYNYTMADLGNIIEVDDGYLLIASSEKTLSLNYAADIDNESRNIFIQKLDKDFENKTAATLQKFSTPLRKSEKNRTSVQNVGSLMHEDEEIVDYGVKWLTNYNSDFTVLEVRGVLLDDGRIALLWAEAPFSTSGHAVDDIKYYYEIIDSNGNVLQSPLEIETAQLTSLIHYNTKDHYIYWTEKLNYDSGLKINRLDLNKTSEKLVFERVGNEEINITDSDVTTYQLEVNTNKDTKLSWHSVNPSVANVSDSGLLTIYKNGNTIVSVTNEEYNKRITYNINVAYQVKNIVPEKEELFAKIGGETTLRYQVDEKAKNRIINWRSASEEIFEVVKTNDNNNSTSGSVTIKGKMIGNAYLIGEAADGSGTTVKVLVKVVNPLVSLTPVTQDNVIYKGKQLKLEVIKNPQDSNEEINWYSGDDEKATVTSDGLVTANNTGTVYIFAQSKIDLSVYAQFKITVVETTLDKESMHLKSGERAKLNLTTYPYDYNPKWETSNAGVATVANDGTVTAVGDGVAKITVTTSNGYSATCVVTVGDYLLGDMDTSGEVNMKDAFIGLKVASKQLAITDVYLQTGDINGNSKVEMNDVFYILKKASKQIS